MRELLQGEIKFDFATNWRLKLTNYLTRRGPHQGEFLVSTDEVSTIDCSRRDGLGGGRGRHHYRHVSDSFRLGGR